MFTYIKKSVSSIYVEFEEELSPELFNNLGTTYQDYLDNKWVLLNEDQVEFHNNHPYASVIEVFNKELNLELERTVEDSRNELLMKINEYNVSPNVDGFTINNAINAWFTVQERLNYRQSVESAKRLGIEKLTFYVDSNELEVNTSDAEMMLDMLQLYADQCFIATKRHQIIANSLQTIEELDTYDYTDGYPQKLNFNL